MFIAIDERGERLPPIKGVPAVCPICKKELIAKIGQIKAPHWAHKVASDCTHGQGMTQWHYSWLHAFAQLDGWEIEVPHGSYRFDAYNAGAMTAVEFQLAVDYAYIKRKSDYCLGQGIALVWVFSEKALAGYTLRADCYQATSNGKRALHEILRHYADSPGVRFAVHDGRIKASVDGAVVTLSAPALTAGIVHASLKFRAAPPEAFVSELCRE